MPANLALRGLGIALLSGLMASSSGAEGKEECLLGCPHEGPQFRRDLAAAIERADRIVVTEHSSPWDATNRETYEPLTREEFVYRTVTLDPEQHRQFHKFVASLDPKTQTWVSACMPLWHHRVSFFEGARLASTLDLCFVCGHVSWDATELTPPDAIHKGMRKFIAKIGLSPERDWRALAHERLAAR